MNDLEMAIGGRIKMINQIFGDSKPGELESSRPRRPMTASTFRDMAARHNRTVRKRGARANG